MGVYVYPREYLYGIFSLVIVILYAVVGFGMFALA